MFRRTGEWLSEGRRIIHGVHSGCYGVTVRDVSVSKRAYRTSIDDCREPLTEGSGLFGFTEEVAFADTELSGVVELFEDEEEPFEGNGDPILEAMVQATLESAGFNTTELVYQDERIKMVSEVFDVVGTVAVNGSVFDMTDCHSEAWSDHVWSMNPNGPKATGHAPDNDVPERAVSLDARSTINAQTKVAAPAPEAACMSSFDGESGPEEFPLPIGKRLLYSFEGTGEPATIDSAGSNFDTIMGICDAGLGQLACVDDESGWSLQAAVTIDTVTGETYLGRWAVSASGTIRSTRPWRSSGEFGCARAEAHNRGRRSARRACHPSSAGIFWRVIASTCCGSQRRARDESEPVYCGYDGNRFHGTRWSGAGQTWPARLAIGERRACRETGAHYPLT